MDSSAEQELRELVEERVAAVRAKNPAPLAERQHPDLVEFNVLRPCARAAATRSPSKRRPGSILTRLTSATRSTSCR